MLSLGSVKPDDFTNVSNDLLRVQLAAALDREQRLLGIIEQRLLPTPKRPWLERWLETWQQVRGKA